MMSDAVNEWLDAAQARCDAATEGPWAVDRNLVYTYVENDECRGCSGLVSPAHEPSCGFREVADAGADDADFIAHARSNLPKAIAALRAVLAIHHWRDGCSETGPCPTVCAITEHFPELIRLHGDPQTQTP